MFYRIYYKDVSQQSEVNLYLRSTIPNNNTNENTSNYETNLRDTRNYIRPSYVSSGKGYGNSVIQGQSHISQHGQPKNTTTINSETYRTPSYVNGQPRTSTNNYEPQPAPSNFRRTSSHEYEETKGNPIANICFGLLGVIAVASLILGILFAVGVIGNKGTNIDPTITNVESSHFNSLHSHTILATHHHHHLTVLPLIGDPIRVPPSATAENKENESENEEYDEEANKESETISEESKE